MKGEGERGFEGGKRRGRVRRGLRGGIEEGGWKGV